MEKEPSEIVLKTSRIYFIGNYIIAALVVLLILLLYFIFNLEFTLFPKTKFEFISTLVLLGISGIAVSMVEQPEWAKFRTKFIVTMNEVIKHEGILNKERVILPYATVADIRVEKSVLGRIFNYGNLSVSSFKAGSDMVMRGIRHPEKIHTIIQNRVNLIREGQLQMFGKGSEEVKEHKITDDKENLKNRKKELLELIEQTKKAFYDREIDENQFERTIEKYQQELMEINIKLKN